MPTSPSQCEIDTKDEAEYRRIISRHRAILASTLDPIITIDRRGIIQSASDSVERVFGYQPDELVGQNISVLMPDPHRSMHDSYLERYHQTGQTNILGRTREFEAVRKDGSLVPVELSVSRVDVPNEEPLFTGIIHDISDRRQAEREVALLHDLSLAITDSSELDEALAALIKKICNVTGWDYGEAWLPGTFNRSMHIGPCWHRGGENFEAFHCASRSLKFERDQGLIGGVFSEGRPRWLTDLNKAGSDELMRVAEARDAGLKSCFAIPVLTGGEATIVLAFFTTEPRQRDDHLLNIVSVAASRLGAMIERRYAELTQNESERKFREMLNDVQVIAVMLDSHGSITFCNDYLLALTGYERGEVLGHNWFDMFLPGDEQTDVVELFKSGLARNTIEPHFENHILTRDGQRRLIAWRNSIMHDVHGRPVGATALGVDITDQREAEALLKHQHQHLELLVQERTRELEETHEHMRHSERLISIGTLAAGLGHDMSNVLLPMRCRLDAIDARKDPESIDEHLRSFRRSIEYLQQLTDALHLLALDPEDSDASSETTDPAEWWECVSPLLARAAPSHAMFYSRFSDGLPPIAIAPHRLTQAVLNLIVNAGDAVDDGGLIRLKVTCPDDQRYVHITMTDNGCGMTDEVKNRALDPFFTTKTRGMGTGLGLPLVHGVTRSAGGSLKIASSPGKGTSITLAIPVVAKPPTGEDEKNAEDRLSACVAVADVRTATLIEVMLHTVGLDVRHVADGHAKPCSLQVIDAAESQSIDVSVQPNGTYLVMLGRPSRPVNEENVTIIDDPTDLEQIRQGLGEVIAQLK